nr:hypothetical protein Iba_chr12aCG17260 [Ipomoea batatas]
MPRICTVHITINTHTPDIRRRRKTKRRDFRICDGRLYFIRGSNIDGVCSLPVAVERHTHSFSEEPAEIRLSHLFVCRGSARRGEAPKSNLRASTTAPPASADLSPPVVCCVLLSFFRHSKATFNKLWHLLDTRLV